MSDLNNKFALRRFYIIVLCESLRMLWIVDFFTHVCEKKAYTVSLNIHEKMYNLKSPCFRVKALKNFETMLNREFQYMHVSMYVCMEKTAKPLTGWRYRDSNDLATQCTH